jgi:hypothetical protein
MAMAIMKAKKRQRHRNENGEKSAKWNGESGGSKKAIISAICGMRKLSVMAAASAEMAWRNVMAAAMKWQRSQMKAKAKAMSAARKYKYGNNMY